MFAVEQIAHLHPPRNRLAFTGPAGARGGRFTDQVVEALLLDTQGVPVFIQLHGDPYSVIQRSLSAPLTRSSATCSNQSRTGGMIVPIGARNPSVSDSSASIGRDKTLRVSRG